MFAKHNEQGVKVYGVQSGHGTNATAFFSKMAELTLGRHVNLTNFSSIFDFLMMICYREGNADMLPVYASEVRAGHGGGVASFKAPPKPTAIKAAKSKASKALPKGKRSAKEMPKTAKAKKAEKPTRKATKKLKGAYGERNPKKALPQKTLMKIKGQPIIPLKKRQAPKQA